MAPKLTEGEYLQDRSTKRVAHRSQDDFSQAQVMISIESDPAYRASQTVEDWMTSNLPLLFEHIRALNRYDQTILLSYFLLETPQWVIGRLLGWPQAFIGRMLRDDITRIGYSMIGRNPYPPRQGSEPRACFEDLHLTDPPELGMFRVDMASPGFASMFSPKTSQLTSTEVISDSLSKTPKPKPLPVIKEKKKLGRPFGSKTRFGLERKVQPGKRLGRPKGSKNKPRIDN